MTISKTSFLVTVGFVVSIFIACATPSKTTMETRLAAMSDDDLISYYHGINDRLKAIQDRMRETDRQGTILEQDQLSKMPFIIGGEVWELEQRRECVRRELVRRKLAP